MDHSATWSMYIVIVNSCYIPPVCVWMFGSTLASSSSSITSLVVILGSDQELGRVVINMKN